MNLNRFPLALAAAACLISASAHANLVNDPSFEGGTPNASWLESSTNFGTPLCTAGACGTGTGTGPRTGNWFAWFGGANNAETSSLSQAITIPVGAAELSFWMENPASSSTAHFLQVLVDNNMVWSYSPGGIFSDAVGYNEYTVDLTAFADGNSHVLEFYSVTNGGGSTNFFVDDVSVVAAPIPEPGTYGLMGLGLAGIWAARRRKTAR
jgi:hypothetical protein